MGCTSLSVMGFFRHADQAQQLFSPMISNVSVTSAIWPPFDDEPTYFYLIGPAARQ